MFAPKSLLKTTLVTCAAVVILLALIVSCGEDPVEIPAKVSVSQESIDLGAVDTQGSFRITNAGGGTLDWKCAVDQSWMSVSPTSGTGDRQITVTVDRSGLSPGQKTGTVLVSGTGGNASVEVTMLVTGVLAVTPQQLDFGTSTDPLILAITNSGQGLIRWNAAADVGWLTCDPTSGAGNGQVSVTVDRTGLSPGDYTGAVTVSSQDPDVNDVVIDVTMSVAQQLSVTPNTMDFGPSGTSLALTVRNIGATAMTWNATTNEDWLSIDPAGSTLASGATIRPDVTVDRSGLAPNTYTGTVTVSTAIENVDVAVSMVVPEADPVLVVSETNLDFGTAATQRTFTIGNNGGGSLTWTVTDDRDWIDMTPAGGQTAPGSPTTITVDLTRSLLLIGHNSGTISISAEGGTQTATIDVTADTWYTARDYFVSDQTGDDGNDGRINTPFKTIQHAVLVAEAAAGGNVHVAEGTYTEMIQLRSDVNLYGGYQNVTWNRNTSTYTTTIVSSTSSTVKGADKSSITIDGFTIRNNDVAPGDVTRWSSIALWLDDCVGVTVTNNRIEAGDVFRDGTDGASAPPPADNGQNGQQGGPGGRGGVGEGSGDRRGGNGGEGAETCATATGEEGEHRGFPCPVPPPPPYMVCRGCGGAGGVSCNPLNGTNGADACGNVSGADGAPGAPGASFGLVNSSGYAPSRGGVAELGEDGGGGGGGGGGGAGQQGPGIRIENGGGGGAGGEGGKGGNRGDYGYGGGASIAVLLTGTTNARIEDNVIVAGDGADGGDGAAGQQGGTGGDGGLGETPSFSWPGDGGAGGYGGDGGDGGFGGGGGGGPSIGVTIAATANGVVSGNTYTIGNGGIGGITLGDGTRAPNGLVQQVYDIGASRAGTQSATSRR